MRLQKVCGMQSLAGLFFRQLCPYNSFIPFQEWFDSRDARPVCWWNDKLAAIRNIWDRWVEHLPLMYNPGPEVSIWCTTLFPISYLLFLLLHLSGTSEWQPTGLWHCSTTPLMLPVQTCCGKQSIQPGVRWRVSRGGFSKQSWGNLWLLLLLNSISTFPAYLPLPGWLGVCKPQLLPWLLCPSKDMGSKGSAISSVRERQRNKPEMLQRWCLCLRGPLWAVHEFTRVHTYTLQIRLLKLFMHHFNT